MKIPLSLDSAARLPLRSLTTLTSPLIAVLPLAVLAGAAQAANITLTESFLNSVHGFVNFAKNPLGSGPNAIPNNLQPGDTVFIQGHTRDLLILTNLTQGTADNPITVTNTGGQFIIDYADPAPIDTGIKIWGAQHVRFKGTPGPGYAYGIKVNRAASVGIKVDYNQSKQQRVGGEFGNTLDLEISEVEIGNVGFAGIQAKYEIDASNVPPGVTALLDDLRIHHCFIHDTGGEGMYLGWTSDGHPDVANILVHDNLLQNTGWDGIQLNRSRGVNEIYNNDIIGYGLTSNTYRESVYFWQASAFSVGDIDSFKLHHNYTKATGKYSGSAVSLFYSDTTQIYNNVFVLGAHGAPKPQTGMYIGQFFPALPDGVTVTIANNTLVEPEFNGIGFRGDVDVPVFITNNIIAHLLSGRYVVPAPRAPTLTTNLFVPTLAEAGFVSATDYHLAPGSPAIDAGTSLSSVKTDFDYNPRPAGAAYDIGAYEFKAVTVLTPVAWGEAAGSGFAPATGAFDEQPTWNIALGEPSGDSVNPHVGTSTGYANRFWYIDFGPNWSKVRITQMWTRYRPSSPGSYRGFASLWWDDDNDAVNDGVTAAGLNFVTAQNLPNVAAQLWVLDRDFSSAAVVPQGRYLVVSTGATVTDRANEFAFIGYVLP